MQKTMLQRLASKSADEFDMAFIEMMTKHHNEAIEMAGLAKKKGAHKEILKLAENIIYAQTKEIKQMKLWKSEWK